MSRNFEARLAKIEMTTGGSRRTHEEWLNLLAPTPLTEAESATADAQMEAEALDEHGSLSAAASAYQAKAAQTRDPLDAFLAADMEVRAMRGVSRPFA